MPFKEYNPLWVKSFNKWKKRIVKLRRGLATIRIAYLDGYHECGYCMEYECAACPLFHEHAVCHFDRREYGHLPYWELYQLLKDGCEDAAKLLVPTEKIYKAILASKF